jgi:hypothetical protein
MHTVLPFGPIPLAGNFESSYILSKKKCNIKKSREKIPPNSPHFED